MAVVLLTALISSCAGDPVWVPFFCIYAKDSSTNGISGLECILTSNSVNIDTEYTTNYDYYVSTNAGSKVLSSGQATFEPLILKEAIEGNINKYYSNFSILIEDPTGVYLTTDVIAQYGAPQDKINFYISNVNYGFITNEYYEFTNQWVFMTKKSN
jgi:hypothetical protein